MNKAELMAKWLEDKFAEKKAEDAAAVAAYYQANKAKIAAKNMAWAKTNPDKIAAKRLRYNSKHRQEQSEYTSQYLKTHPEVNRANQNRRRAIKSGSAGSYTGAEFVALCDKYAHRCLSCGKKRKLTADHVKPLCKGGSNSIDNIQPLCQHCNCSKGTKEVDYRKVTQ